MRFERDDAKIGLLVFLAGAVFVGLVFYRSLTAVVKQEAILKVRLTDASGLEAGTEVQLQGHRIGQVNQIALKREGPEYYFLATIGIRPDIVLWKGTIAIVASKGIGSSFLDLNLPPPENRLTPLEHDSILYGETGASLGTLITEVQGFVQNLDGTLNELKGHLKEKGLGAVLDHPQVRKVLLDLDATLLEFRKVAVRGDVLLKHGQDSAETLDRSLTSLEKSALMIESLLDKRSGDLDDIIGNLSSLIKELQSLSTDMHKLLKDSGPEMEGSLRSLHRNLKSTEELLELLKNKPSRILWGTPSAAEKEAARKKALENQSQQNQGQEPSPAP